MNTRNGQRTVTLGVQMRCEGTLWGCWVDYVQSYGFSKDFLLTLLSAMGKLTPLLRSHHFPPIYLKWELCRCVSQESNYHQEPGKLEKCQEMWFLSLTQWKTEIWSIFVPTQIKRKLRSERRPWCLHPQAHGSRFPVCPSQAFHAEYTALFKWTHPNI